MHHILGDYYSVKPVAVRSPIDVYDCNKRSILELESSQFGQVLYIMIAAVQVGSIKLTAASGDRVRKVRPFSPTLLRSRCRCLMCVAEELALHWHMMGVVCARVSLHTKMVYRLDHCILAGSCPGKQDRAPCIKHNLIWRQSALCVQGEPLQRLGRRASEPASRNAPLLKRLLCVKGQELGWFQYGGSTVITVFRRGAIRYDEDLLRSSARAVETLVKMGTSLGVAQ